MSADYYEGIDLNAEEALIAEAGACRVGWFRRPDFDDEVAEAEAEQDAYLAWWRGDPPAKQDPRVAALFRCLVLDSP